MNDANHFISLDRSFHELVVDEKEGDEGEIRRSFSNRSQLRWDDLLRLPRVILLSEAGAGKTAEILHTANRLRLGGKPAFFLRIEHVVHDFDSSFEVGTAEEFQDWVASSEHGWLLLDSVDEARLREPKDFEAAIRKIGRALRTKLQDVHIVITGRTSAWRPSTDLLLCRTILPWVEPTRVVSNVLTKEAEGSNSVGTSSKAAVGDAFKIVALDDLSEDLVADFAAAKGMTDIDEFKTAIERADAWSFTQRPLDLSEMIDFWINNKRMGSRLELMRNSITRRLEERDQDRSEARPMSTAKAQEGIRLVAAAVTLSKASAIRVPDGSANTKGIPIKEILPDWDDVECATLLSRPIFDEGIYGTVRFHHRSVREFLTAEWLQSLMVSEASRQKIEALFFRNQYGIEVVVPTLRPVLPWLAILDEKVLIKVCRLAPEILFEGGDPSQLPIETRREILDQACEHLAQPAHSRSMTDHSAVQRFANNDLADDIGRLLDQYSHNEDIAWFLLRMVWLGNIAPLVETAKRFTDRRYGKYVRVAAIRAVIGVGNQADGEDLRSLINKDPKPLNRHVLAELIPTLPENSPAISWLLEVLEKTEPKERFETDYLQEALPEFVQHISLECLPQLMTGLSALLKTAPLMHRHGCHISASYGWLLSSATKAVVRLASIHSVAALSSDALEILRIVPCVRFYDPELYEYKSFDELTEEITPILSNWPELNFALFWHSAAERRRELEGKSGTYLREYWQVSPSGSFGRFEVGDFDKVCVEINGRVLLDDQHIALSLAFSLYLQAGRPQAWRAKLKKIVEKSAELKASLDRMLSPTPDPSQSHWKREEAAWKRKIKKQEERRDKELQEAKAVLFARREQLRHPNDAGAITGDQYYLHEKMREMEQQNNRWTEGDWKLLIGVYGSEVAEAFRDGLVGYWRHNSAVLRSEGAQLSSTPTSVIFGLSGIAIEARESAGWPAMLHASDVERAVRYAVHELNGFPAWFPALSSAFPDIVKDVLLKEIRFELNTEAPDVDSHYVLSDVAWQAPWIWDYLAPALLTELSASRKNSRNLGYILSIVHGSSVEDSVLAKIAARKAKTIRSALFSPIWFAVWVGVEPDIAIPALAARLAEIKDPSKQTDLAVSFVVCLIGGRTQEGRSRQAYRTVEYIKNLFLLMHRYIRRTEDIDRVGGGVYSPGIRDDAQDARHALFQFIQEAPGKEAYLALLEMGNAHPDSDSRPWMNFYAKKKATADADVAPWTLSQVREFNRSLVCTPTNHRELWYLAVDRLNDLKYDLENGDTSIASLLQSVDAETEFRKFIGGWCRDRAAGRYNVPQEEELADSKRPDLRFLGTGNFDGPVPIELKIADKWTGPALYERLENQLSGSYLRDIRSSRGIFLLLFAGTKKRTYWDLPGGGRASTLVELVDALQAQWAQISHNYPNVEDIAVIGIDLTIRGTIKNQKRSVHA
jgi:hypothetical protein